MLNGNNNKEQGVCFQNSFMNEVTYSLISKLMKLLICYHALLEYNDA